MVEVNIFSLSLEGQQWIISNLEFKMYFFLVLVRVNLNQRVSIILVVQQYMI